MSFSARYVPAVLFTLLSLAVTLSAQSTSPQATKAPARFSLRPNHYKRQRRGGVAVESAQERHDQPL